jgi:hypothetical protein
MARTLPSGRMELILTSTCVGRAVDAAACVFSGSAAAGAVCVFLMGFSSLF